MEFGLNKIKNYLTERRKADKRKRAESEAKREILPVCRLGENGELINEIVVCGMPLFQVSDNDGRWNVNADDIGEVIKHLRDAYVTKLLNQ
ncbi:MAG: hypothetical protein IJ640_10590 [Prevotella sp.]|nr:hypothetical protein [Prevotella sp.]